MKRWTRWNVKWEGLENVVGGLDIQQSRKTHPHVLLILILSPTSVLTLPAPRAFSKVVWEQKAVFDFEQTWNCGWNEQGSKAGSFHNTSHMTLSMGGLRKLSLCFCTPHPPNCPTYPSVSFSKSKEFQRPEPNRGAFLHALILLPIKCLSVSSDFASSVDYTSQEVPGGIES